MEEKDAIIVGARCAGSTLAIALADRGWDVLLVDRDTFPSDTVSTHMIYPNTIARLERLGDPRHAARRPRPAAARVAGDRPRARDRRRIHPVDGHDHATSARRLTLDKAIVAWGRFPRPELTEKLFIGWASELDAGQDLRDTFSRQVEPSSVMSRERLARWFGNAQTEHA